MIRYILAVLAFIVPAFGQTPTVTITNVDGLSHSVVRLTVNVSASYANFRTRYIASPGTCTGGTGGTVQSMEPATMFTTGMRVVVGGLAPNTSYQVCPEVTADNTNWSSGVGTTITTLPLPAVHPAPPIAPQTFSTAYPNTSGYTSVTVAADCSDFQSDLNTAAANAMTNGTIINIAPGTPCGAGAPYTIPPAADTYAFAPSAVNTSTSTINIPNHGFTEGQGVLFGTSYSTLPASTSCTDGTGLAEQGFINGQEYYVHVVDANNFEVYCTTATPGVPGVLMTFTSQGSGTNYICPWNHPSLHWVIIRTSTPDAQFAPAQTRVSPAWASKMAVFTKPNANQSNRTTAGQLFDIGANDGNVQIPVANIRFVGIEFTFAQVTDSTTSNDPLPWGGFVYAFPTDQNIIFDRCYFHMLPAPSRTLQGFYWDGSNMAIVDSYLDNLTYWHGAYTGYATALASSTQMTVGPGTYYMAPGHTYTLTSTETVNFSGSGSGNWLMYYDFSGNMTIALAPGIGASCTGPVSCTVVTLGSSPAIGNCNTSTSAFPRNASGNLAAGPIVCGTNTSGAVTSGVSGDGTSSIYATEGCNFMVGGNGPGPYIFQDNFMEGAGLAWHHDDSGGDTRHRGDFTYYRNYFLAQFAHMYQSPVSDGFRYFHRHMLEWKSGDRIDLNGNVFDGCWSEDTPIGDCFETASLNWVLRDVNVHNNTFMHTPAGFLAPTIVPGGLPQGQPPVRTRVFNNLFWDMTGSNYYSPCCQLGGKGWILTDGGVGAEDLVFDHNTVVQNTGTIPSIWAVEDTFHEGVQITNNFLYLTAGDWGFQLNDIACPNGQGKATADCLFTNGYRFDHNVLLSGSSQAAVQAAWPTLFNYIPSNPSSMAAAGWFNYDAAPLAFVNGNPKNYNFRVKTNYCSGCSSPASDGLDVGADMNALEAAQGKVTLIGVPNSSITNTTAMVAFVAPDSFGCTVDYSSTDPTLVNNFTRVANSGGTRAQNVTLSGLTTKTDYYFRVNCSIQQPTGQFRTQ